jgi:hypothetical protein
LAFPNKSLWEKQETPKNLPQKCIAREARSSLKLGSTSLIIKQEFERFDPQ